MAHTEKTLEVRKLENDSNLLSHYLQSHELKLWPLLSILNKKFLLQIEITMWFGKNDGSVNWPATLIVTKDKNVYSVSSKDSRLSRSNILNTLPQKVEALCQKNIKTITGIGESFFVLTEEGKVYSWGCKFGTLAYDIMDGTNDTLTIIPYPLEVSGLADKRVVDIKCGHAHVLVLTDDKKMYSWGDNYYGQTNHSGADKIRTPTEVIIEDEFGKKDVQSISCGSAFNVAITCDGELYSWGENTRGQLGQGIISLTNPKPTKIMIPAAIAKVECGSHHTLALTREGLLYVWGDNDDGQLGFGMSVVHVFCPNPMDTREIGKITDIATQSDCSISVAINRDNRFYLWGCKRFMKIYNPCTSLDKFEKLSHVMSTKYLETAFNNSASADVELIVDKESLYIHRIIIMLRCPEMYARFFTDNTDNNVIIRDDFSFAAYKSFLKYLYTRTVDLLDEKPLELYDLAISYYDETFMKKYMIKIKRRINISNVIDFYAEAILKPLKMKELEEFCFTYAVNNLSAVVKTESYAKLSEKIRLDFIIKAADAEAFKH